MTTTTTSASHVPEPLRFALVDKWHNHIAPGVSGHIQSHTAMVLEAQAHYFRNMRADNPEWAVAVAEIVGDEWDEAILHAIGHTLPVSSLVRLVSFQATGQPIGLVSHVRQETLNAPSAVDQLAALARYRYPFIYDRTLAVESMSVQANSRNTHCRIPHLGNDYALFGGELRKAALELVFAELWLEILHDALAKCLYSVADDDHHVCSQPGGMRHAVQRARMSVLRLGQRGPANHLIANEDMRLEIGHFQAIGAAEVTTFDIFPVNTVLAFYKGAAFFDAPVVWSPFVFQLAIPGPKIDPETFQQYPNGLAIVRRDKITIVAPNQIAVIKVDYPPGAVYHGSSNLDHLPED